MADESIHPNPLDYNMDFHIVALLKRLEAMRKDTYGKAINNRILSALESRRNFQGEFRTLEFWRSIISECLASFLYVFIVCGAAAGAGVGASVSSVLLATALASGLAIMTLTQCFIHISGAHVNPAVTLAACVIRMVSPTRAAMYITAQCGGGIAGAALLYGVTVPGYQGNLQAAISYNASLASWERFGVEFSLTFVVVFTYFVSTDELKQFLGNSTISIGAAYSACSFVSMPYLNPARSLGPSFVLNKWDNHWIYWFGPLLGGVASGLMYEYVFNLRRISRLCKTRTESDSKSLHSEDDINYNLEIDDPTVSTKYQSVYLRNKTNVKPSMVSNPGTIPSSGNFCQNLYTAPPLTKFEEPEPLYGGTRSMYCRSPTLARCNLNRSQSVYTKSSMAINRETIPRPGPLVPAQSLYGMRFTQTQTQSSHVNNQNAKNQMQQRSESIYGTKESTKLSQQPPQELNEHHQTQQRQPQKQYQTSQLPSPTHHIHQQQSLPSQPNQVNQINLHGFQSVYGTQQNPNLTEGSLKNQRRPESAYAASTQRSRGQSDQSEDSSYGSYHGSAATPRNINGAKILLYAPPNHSQMVSPITHTQSERKVTTPVVSSQSIQVTNCSAIYSTRDQIMPQATHQPLQHPQILAQQQANQKQQHYSMFSPRAN